MHKCGIMEKKHLTMEEAFHILNRHFIRLKASEKKCNNFILHSVLKNIINKMRACDKLFDSMHPRLDYLGSYYDGLRVGEPTEYDINIILSIPVNKNKIVLDASGSEYDHTSIIMPSEFRRLAITPATATKGFTKTLLWCDSDHRVSVAKFRSWIQSVVDTTLNTLPLENGRRIIKVNSTRYCIETRTSGPANTLTIIKENNCVIDVDLVPTFAFTLPKKPANSPISFTKVNYTNIKQYFVVPKPTKNDFSWRLTFPFQEKCLIRAKNNLKSTVRLLKRLRDVQGFKKLCSYHIKTLFLWEIGPEKEKMWKKKSLTFLFLYMLKKLRDCLLKAEIRNYWCPEHNLLEKLKKDTCFNWGNRLTIIINDLEKSGKNNGYVIHDYLIENCER